MFCFSSLPTTKICIKIGSHSMARPINQFWNPTTWSPTNSVLKHDAVRHYILHTAANFNYHLLQQHKTILVVSGPHQWVFFSLRPRKSKVVIIMTFLKNMTCQLWKELVIKMMIHDKSYLLPFGVAKLNIPDWLQ